MSWFSRKDWEQDANDELRFHIEQQTAANICYIPARRAMRVDPMTALRYE